MADNSAYLNAFKTGIIRISHANGVVVGAGFLVSPNYVLTCAHLVAQALTIPPNTPDVPTGLIDLDFPLIAPGQKIKARVEFRTYALTGRRSCALALSGCTRFSRMYVRKFWIMPLGTRSLSPLGSVFTRQPPPDNSLRSRLGQLSTEVPL